MNRSQLLAARIREVYLDGRWIANTNYKEQLEATSWQHAFHQFGKLNTIAALTFHVNYYLAGLIAAFTNGKLEISDRYSFDMKPDSSEAYWNELVNEVLQNAEKFAALVEAMDEEQLNLPFIDEKYGSFLRNIEGVIEHSYYHLGQVSLIGKLIREN